MDLRTVPSKKSPAETGNETVMHRSSNTFKNARTTALLAGALLVLASNAHADSLWQRGKANPVSLVSDNRARRIGDIVTIVIDEKQKVKNGENMKTQKTSSADGSLVFTPAEKLVHEANQLEGIDDAENPLDSLLPISLTSNRDFEGKADFNKEGSFTTRITSVVIDVQPNGNLVVEGKRRVVIDGEEKWMTITGLVRSFDVSSDNNVASALVANAQVQYSSDGPLAKNTSRGWLDRFIDFIWPF